MSDRPNLILITADQWRGDCLGFLQGPHPVMTPHLNQLAAEGVHFAQAYADCPVCMPQRASMMTGESASRFGMPYMFMNGEGRTPIAAERSLPGRLRREAGYECRAIGKMHFSPPRARFGFDHVTLHPDDYITWLEGTPYAGLFRGHGLGGNEVYPTTAPMPERFTHTHWVVDQAIEFLYQRDPDCPFFLWIIFEAPHSPFDPPEPFDRMYDNFTIPPPIHGDWSDDDLPPMLRRKRRQARWELLSDEMVAEARRRYYGQISHIDYQLGRFLGELKDRALYDDTAILFNSDHGEHLGDHGVFAKSTYLHGSGDVPFVLKLPRRTTTPAQQMMTIETPVLTADVSPTFLDLAGLEPNPEIDGESLLPWVRNGAPRQRTICGETAGSSAFSLDGRYKYIYWPEGGIEQLFDVTDDRANLHNLALSGAHADKLTTLRRALIEYLQRFDRPLARGGELITTDPPTEPVPIQSTSQAALRGPMRYGRGY